MSEESGTPAVLIVDDEESILNSLRRLLRRERYEVLTARSGAEGMEIIEGRDDIGVVVSDHMMPGMNGVEFLSQVRLLSPHTVRMMLTGYADRDASIAAINRGGVERYITKPWDDGEMRLVIADALKRFELARENRRLTELTARQNEQLRELNLNLEKKVELKTRTIRENFFSFIKIFADLMEMHDPNLGGHSKRTARHATRLASALGLDTGDVELIESAALLHNIGFVGMPRGLADREIDTLTDDERALVVHAPVLAQRLLRRIDTLRQVGVIIRSLHENYDGTGYPDGLRHEEIHIGSRIIAAAKRYDRLTFVSELTPRAAVETMKKERGTVLDPEIVNALADIVGADDVETRWEAIPLSKMKPGMVLLKDLRTGRGRLLAASRTRLTETIIERIHNFHSIDPVIDDVYVGAEAQALEDREKTFEPERLG
ncbi:MAG TPA: response regulator [Deltaproteobacteria bacterium]|nr:response regulator [Deltaproteobacteria bacterium]